MRSGLTLVSKRGRMPKITIAAAQIECIPSAIEANLAKHLDAIERAKSIGADLLVFAELSLTDYVSEPNVSLLARSTHSAEIEALAEAAENLYVSFGFIEAGVDGLAYNSQALVRGGEIHQVHRKLNLPTYGNLKEGNFYTRGNDITLAEIAAHWKAATLICADSWSPDLPWLSALKGANLLIQPIASARGAVEGGFDNPGGWEINLRHTAITYGLPIVMANHCGKRGGLDFWGGSRILDANGKELARAEGDPSIISAVIEFQTGEIARLNLPTIRDVDVDFVRNQLKIV